VIAPALRTFPGATLALVLLAVCLGSSAAAQPVAGTTSRFMSYEDALPTLTTLADDLPAELAAHGAEKLAAQWPPWVKKSDRDIRARLAQGDEDSLVNLIFLGTTFTQQPRATEAQIQATKKQVLGATTAPGKLPALIDARLDDFVRALAQPSREERISFAQEFLTSRASLDLATVAGQKQAKALLLASIARVLNELESFTRIVDEVKLLGDDTALFVERSQIYRNRGLSSDTTLRPNFAIEETLKELLAKGFVAPGQVNRVAVVGPGLDFADKQAGYDFYPQQTIQPFALMDTLLRLGLATATDVQVTTLDLSPKINDHIQRVREQGLRGEAYTLQLPFALREGLQPGFIQYWEAFGSKVGAPAEPVPIPATVTGLKLRAVAVQPSFAARVKPVDTNIVLQYLDLPEAEKFDLIVGTNIFIYYDGFQKSLALANVSKMLRVGGFLLSNHALLEIPSSKVNWTGFSQIKYSDTASVDGDFIVWYRRNP